MSIFLSFFDELEKISSDKSRRRKAVAGAALGATALAAAGYAAKKPSAMQMFIRRSASDLSAAKARQAEDVGKMVSTQLAHQKDMATKVKGLRETLNGALD